MYYGNKAQDFEIYNPNSESTITVIKPTAAIIDLSAIVCTKAAVTAAKIFQQFLFEIVCSIQYIPSIYELNMQMLATSVGH